MTMFEQQQEQWRQQIKDREQREAANIVAFFARIHGQRLSTVEFEDRCYMRNHTVRTRWTLDDNGIIVVR